MANIIRFKRRASGGAAGAPATLKHGEPAYNEVDDILYYGKGAGSGGNASAVVVIGGSGAFLTLSGAQTVTGQKTFSNPTTFEGNVTVTSGSIEITNGGQFIGIGTSLTALNAAALTVGVAPLSAIPTGTTALTVALGNHNHDTVYVALTGNQTVAGTKTFSAAPVVPTPTLDTQAANKGYVDSAVDSARAGLSVKEPVRAATTANITLSGTQTIDNVVLAVDDRVLVKNQTTATQNGIYLVKAGAWVRATDADASAEVNTGMFCFVSEGTLYGDSGWVLTTNGTITVGTTALAFEQFSGAGQIVAGTGLTKTGNRLDVVSGAGITTAADSVALAGQALALYNLGTNGLIVRTGAGTVAGRTIVTSGDGISIENGNGGSANPSISLDTPLSTIGGLTPAADRIPYYTGASTAALATLTSFARTLLDDTSNSTARTTLGLGSIATQSAAAVAITGGSIDNIDFDGGTF